VHSSAVVLSASGRILMQRPFRSFDDPAPYVGFSLVSDWVRISQPCAFPPPSLSMSRRAPCSSLVCSQLTLVSSCAPLLLASQLSCADGLSSLMGASFPWTFDVALAGDRRPVARFAQFFSAGLLLCGTAQLPRWAAPRVAFFRFLPHRFCTFTTP